MSELNARGWVRRGALGLGGAVAGAAVGVGSWALLYQGEFVRPEHLPRLGQAWIAVTLWLAALGAAAACCGRWALRATEERFLPPETTGGGRMVFRIAGAVALCFGAQHQVSRFLLDLPTDLPSFLLAARALAAGADFYDPAVIVTFADVGAPHQPVFPYLYLPIFAVLMLPLSALSQPTATAAVLLINFSLWPLLIVLAHRLWSPPPELRGPMAAMALVLVPTFYPTILTLHHGSPGLLVAVLVVGTLVAERAGRSRLAGVLLALAVLIKIVPVVLVAYFLLRRRWRVLAAASVAGTALLALSLAVAGVGPHLHWLLEMAPGLASGARTGTFFEPACHPENQSLTGICCRLIGEGSAWFRPVSSALGVLVVGITALVLWRRRRPRLDGLEASVVVVTLLLISTITWFHHMTLMVLPLGVLVVEAARRRGWRRTVLAVLLVPIIFGIAGDFYIDPWRFVVPSRFTHTIRFQAMVLTYLILLGMLVPLPSPTDRRPPSSAET